jgi:hypothetical protein
MNMKTIISFRALAVTLLIALTVSYLLCIAADLLLGWTMYQAWAPLLPAFTWPLTFGGFLIGLLWLVGYSLYCAALIAIPYNYFIKRERSTSPNVYDETSPCHCK